MIIQPVFIIGCPRAGTTLLYNILSEVPELWSIGYESKAIIEKYHSPATKDWKSGELSANDLTPESRAYILQEFERQAAPGTFWRKINRFRGWLRTNTFYQIIKQRAQTNSTGAAFSSALPQQGLDIIRRVVNIRNRIFPTYRPKQLLEKTPENCLRLPFLLELFPDARIIYLVREGPANINSLMEGWRQPHTFSGYQVPGGVSIPGDTRGRWAFTLIPDWKSLRDRPLEEVCAWQWVRCNQAVLEHRDQTRGNVPYLMVRYEDMISIPGEVLTVISKFLEVPYKGVLSKYAEALPKINTISAPASDKWRLQNGAAIERVMPIMQPMLERLHYPVSSNSV